MSGRSPTINAAMQAPAWYLDLAGTNGGSDSNSGASAGSPLLTCAELLGRFGTNAPIWRQSTVINVLSGHSDDTDPLPLAPLVEHGAIPQIVGVPAVVASGVLGTVTAKNRNSNQLLNVASLPAGAAVGQYIVNATRSNSRALIYKSLGAGAFALTQPFAAVTFPASPNRAQNDTWATGDSVTIYSLPNLNLTKCAPDIQDVRTSGDTTRGMYVQGITVFDPNAQVLQNTVKSSAMVRWFDCVFQRRLHVDGGDDGGHGGTNNCALLAGLDTTGIRASTTYNVIGGSISFSTLMATLLDGDPIVTGILTCLNTMLAGTVAFDGSLATMTLINAWLQVLNSGYGAQFYGASTFSKGFLRALGSSRVTYPSGAGNAQATFTATGGMTISDQATAYAVDATSDPAIVHAGRSITPLLLDTAVASGGFAGNAFIPGGGSIANF